MSSYCDIHGGFSSNHDRHECPILSDVEQAIRHALGWRTFLLPASKVAKAVRLAFDAALTEDTAETRERARRAAEDEVRRQYQDEAYRNSQAEQRAAQEIATANSRARRKIEAEHANMRDVLTGFVQALVDAHLPHEAVSEAVDRVVAEADGAPGMGRDAFAFDMADLLVGDPVEVERGDR